MTRPTIGELHLAHLARLRRAPWMPWQHDVAMVAGELNPDGVGFAHRVIVLHVPRRAGKTVVAVSGATARMDLLPDARCWYTAQTRETAAKLFRDEWSPMFERLSHLYRLRKSQGSEGIHKRRGSSRLQLFAPTPDALHSTNVDTALVDEAWAFDLDEGAAIEGGITPAQLTRPWAQLWVISAGGTVESTWLDRWITLGEAGTPGVALFDYGAPPDADIADPAVWARAHPAFGHTVGPAALQHEWDTRLDDAAFARSILNVWPRPSAVAAAAGLNLAAWSSSARPPWQLERVDAIALDVAADRSAAAIALAGRRDGRVLVEIVDHRPGVGWLAAAVRDVRAAHRGAPIVADALVAASIVAELRRARVAVTAVSGQEHARSCGTLVDLLETERLAHRAQQALDDAIAGARRRPYGDAWLWSRARSGVDISPLVAATLAVGAAHARPAAGRAAVVAAPADAGPRGTRQPRAPLSGPHNRRSGPAG